MTTGSADAKRSMIKMALDKGLIQVVVDATKPGVKLPDHLLGSDRVTLNLSWAFKTPMELGDAGLSAVLSFGGKNEEIMLPWDSIWLLKTPDQALLFYESAPFSPEKATPKLDPKELLKALEGGSEITPPRKNHLRLLN